MGRIIEFDIDGAGVAGVGSKSPKGLNSKTFLVPLTRISGARETAVIEEDEVE